MRLDSLTLVLLALPVFAEDRNGCGADPATWAAPEKEQFLLAAAVDSGRSPGRGVTGSLRASLRQGECLHDAHIQRVDESKISYTTDRGTEFGFRDCYKFNIAAYLLDRMLKLDMVPPSVPRTFGGRRSAFTWWVDNVAMDESTRRRKKLDPPDRERWNRQMWIVRVFDQLIANTDRNLGNLLIDRDWNLWMIDHTRAFRTVKEVPTPKNLEKCDRVLLERLRSLDAAAVRDALQPYLAPAEIAGLLARRGRLVAFFEEKCAREGESAALYEYLSRR